MICLLGHFAVTLYNEGTLLELGIPCYNVCLYNTHDWLLLFMTSLLSCVWHLAW